MEDLKLLLVDDEQAFRQGLAKALMRRGFVLAQAQNGEECLSILDKEPTDVVILDVKMPGMNGLELLDHIKKGI